MFQVEETPRARLQSRGKLDSVTQGLKRASSKESMERIRILQSNQQALGLLRCGDKGGNVQVRHGPRALVGLSRQADCLDTVAPTFLCKLSQAP